MTNREKCADRLDEFWFGDLSDNDVANLIAVKKNGDLDLCSRVWCHDCIFEGENCVLKAREWLNSEAEPDKEKK